MRNKVIVIGGVHHNTLGVIRSLGYVGIKPYVIITTTDKNPYICHSKYIEKYWILTHDSEIISLLLEKFGREKDKPIVIACADFLAAILDQHREELLSKFFIPGSVKGLLTHYMNKETMRQLAEESGLRTPRSFVLDQKNPQPVPIPYPWIIKPLVSMEGSKMDISRIYSDEDWKAYQESNHCEQIQIQQLIDKDFEYQLIGCSIGGGETLIIPGVSHCIHPSPVTNTGFLRYEPLKDAVVNFDACRKFMATVGYEGLFSMEFLRGKDGKDYFMETNFRNDGNAICVTAAGVNLPALWVKYCLGERIDTEKQKVTKTVYANPEINDFYMMATRRISFGEWIRDLRKTDVFMEYAKTDPKPFRVYARQYAWHIIKKILHIK